jgi:hypothetical protein
VRGSVGEEVVRGGKRVRQRVLDLFWSGRGGESRWRGSSRLRVPRGGGDGGGVHPLTVGRRDRGLSAAATGRGVVPKQGKMRGGGDADVWGPRHSASGTGQMILKPIQWNSNPLQL